MIKLPTLAFCCLFTALLIVDDPKPIKTFDDYRNASNEQIGKYTRSVCIQIEPDLIKRIKLQRRLKSYLDRLASRGVDGDLMPFVSAWSDSL